MKDDIKNSIHAGIPAQNYEVDILPRYKEALSLGLSSYKHHLQKTKITASTGSVFKVPFSVIAAWIMGIPMDLDFNLMETGSLFISVLLKAFNLQSMGVRLAGMHLNSAFGGALPPGISGTNDRCTILVSNLDPGCVSGTQAFEMIAIAAINLSYLYATYINHHILPKLLCLKATSAEILYSEIEESELSDASSKNLKDGSSPSLTLIRKRVDMLYQLINSPVKWDGIQINFHI